MTEEDIKWSSLVNSEFFWSIPMYSMRLTGGTPRGFERQNEFKPVAQSVFIDTGMSFSMMPKQDLLTLIQHLNTVFNMECDNPSSSAPKPVCKCRGKRYADFPTL